jgi:hypothetical protein
MAIKRSNTEEDAKKIYELNIDQRDFSGDLASRTGSAIMRFCSASADAGAPSASVA